MSRSAFVGVFIGLSLMAVLLAGQGVAFANAPNSMPYSESFEGYAPDTVIVDMSGNGINGWYGGTVSTVALAVVVASNYTYSGTTPITNENHTQVMSFNGTITNVFNAPPSPFVTNVYVDTMIQAGYLDANPPVDNSVQCAVYVNTNGHLVIRHARYIDNFSRIAQMWTEMTNGPTLASNQWFRLTIKMDYLTSGLNPVYPNLQESEHYYQVSVDGGEPISDPNGYSSPIVIDQTQENGPWFLCADSGSGQGQAGPNHKYFSSMGLTGLGSVDDLVITPEGISTNVIRPSISAIVSAGASNAVAWGSVVGQRYSVYRSSDLLSTDPVPGGWNLITNDIPADPSGTTIFWDTNPPQPPTNAAFYKVRAQ